jgi:hypothetical protein
LEQSEGSPKEKEKDNHGSLANMPLKTVYVGPIIQCKSLTELDINLHGSIGVDEHGKISFVSREHFARSDPEWLEADVVHLGKNEFLFPGFIGEYFAQVNLHFTREENKASIPKSQDTSN